MSTPAVTSHPHTTADQPEDEAVSLRRLYYGRFAFAVVWAGLLAATASSLGPASVTLLLVYPLFDAAAAVFDLRSAAARQRVPLLINLALSLLTVAGLAVAATSGIPDVLRVWGAWAITAGIVQLVVAIRRQRLGGQLAMILSGGISVLAGAGFVLMADGADASLTSLAGYATLGGIFFLVSAVRLHRAAVKADR
ncbi:hypothetical protein [Nocardioides dongkuii]|uniref:hypothetical protein n=1 Tax=Nocardioides dongkuii TaxID=2760089 RepID=UPI0015FAD2FC|nr:hypothetical protein [Nocardioides dongkuii]